MAVVIIKKRERPIILDYVRAKKLKQRKYGFDGFEKAKPSDSVDLGEWSGEFGLIASIDLSMERRTDNIKKEYGNEDSKEFGIQLKKYLDKKGDLTTHKELEFLRDSNTITFTVRVKGKVKSASDFEIAVIYENVKQYEVLTDRISAWRSYKGRCEYAKKKELEQLEDISKGMKVN